MPESPLERWKKEKERAKGIPEKKQDDSHRYKKMGEHCDHPADSRAVEDGKFGRYVICLLCGKLLNDKG